MAQLFDQICRTLATPMPRSRALKLIFGGLAGVALAPLSFGQQGVNPPGREACGTIPDGCPPGQNCCFDSFCCAHVQGCCVNTSHTSAVCCPPGKSCVDGECV